jgi:hypothetical protein
MPGPLRDVLSRPTEVPVADRPYGDIPPASFPLPDEQKVAAG